MSSQTRAPMLQGVRVLELTHALAGPYCCMLLADMGADVIKIEPPGTGDYARKSMGSFVKGEDGVGFLAVNRNKRGITLNLKSESGKAVFYDLIATADIVVENYRPGVVKKLEIDFERAQEVNPRIIYASISGFGQTGPYAERPGFDLIAQGMSGVMSVTGEKGGEPAKCGIPITDLAAALFCSSAILAAYIARGRTGQGCYIDTSLFEAALALSVWETSEYWATGEIPGPVGSAHRLAAPYQALRTKDGYITVGGNNEKLWTNACVAIGREDLLTEERYSSNIKRMENREALVADLEEALRKRTTAEWVEILLEAGVPAGPLYNYAETLADPHTIARNMTVEIEHPVEGRLSSLGFPVKFSEGGASIRTAAPLLGQHTEEVLAELGYDARGIEEMRADSAI